MKTILIMLSAALFLLCPTVLISQTVYTVDIPGIDHYIHYNSGTGGYGSGNNSLYVGKNGDVYRSYISWENILSYVPSGSELTNVEFYITWGGQGSSSAQIEFRDLTLGANNTQTYANIGSGTLWGTRSATTTTYSFTQLTEKVQSSVNGSGSIILIGIKNQNESSSDYYVSYIYNVSLRVSYLGSSVEVTQVDEQGSPFGQVGRWLNNDWNYINVPFSLNLQSGSDLGLKSDQNFKQGTYQKYWEWTQNSEVTIPNPHNFTVLTGSNLLRSTFKTAYEGVVIKNDLESTGIDGGSV